MPRLIIYVPFTRGAPPPEGDLRVNSAELAQAPLAGFTIGGAPINSVVDVFSSEEAVVGNQVVAGDVLCVHAHGGTGNYVDVTDNLGEDMTLADLQVNLGTLNAANAAACYFFVCFSAEQNHIADIWKAANQQQTVFGKDGIAEGGIIYTTRTKIRASLFDTTNRQLRQL